MVVLVLSIMNLPATGHDNGHFFIDFSHGTTP